MMIAKRKLRSPVTSFESNDSNAVEADGQALQGQVATDEQESRIQINIPPHLGRSPFLRGTKISAPLFQGGLGGSPGQEKTQPDAPSP